MIRALQALNPLPTGALQKPKAASSRHLKANVTNVFTILPQHQQHPGCLKVKTGASRLDHIQH